MDEVVRRSVTLLYIVERAIQQLVALPIDKSVTARRLFLYAFQVYTPGAAETGRIRWYADTCADLDISVTQEELPHREEDEAHLETPSPIREL